MKKLPVYVIAVFLSLLLFFACKRDDLGIKKETSAFSINQAKDWFTKNVNQGGNAVATKTTARIINGLPKNNKILLWKFAIQKKNKQVDGVEVPYAGTSVIYELPDSSFKNNTERDAIVKGMQKER